MENVTPSYYLGKTGLTPVKIIEDFDLSYNRGTALVYIIRAGRKPGEPELKDLRKGAHHLEMAIREAERRVKQQEADASATRDKLDAMAGRLKERADAAVSDLMAGRLKEAEQRAEPAASSQHDFPEYRGKTSSELMRELKALVSGWPVPYAALSKRLSAIAYEIDIARRV